MPVRRRLLRWALGFAALVWGVSWSGVFLPWNTAVTALSGLGAGPMPHDPMLDYWLRMAAGAFGFVGGLYLLAALRPGAWAVVIPWLGWLMLGEGLVLLVHGWRLGLEPWPWFADVTACLAAGGVIVALAPKSGEVAAGGSRLPGAGLALRPVGTAFRPRWRRAGRSR
jgi:hypothetical protein